MKYFKHHCNASDREFLKEVLEKFGHEGYAIWFNLLEILGTEIDKEIDAFRRGKASTIHARASVGVKWASARVKSCPARVIELLRFAQRMGRLCNVRSRKDRGEIEYECPNFLENIDEYTRKLVKEMAEERGLNPANILIVSGVNPDTLSLPTTTTLPSPPLPQSVSEMGTRKAKKRKASGGPAGEDPGPEGPVVAVVPEGSDPERIRKHASVRLSTPILEAAGVDKAVCEPLARAHPAIRILHVCEHGKKQENPGGFIRRALEEGWRVPDSNGEGLANLTAALEVEIAAKDRAWGPSILKRASDYPTKQEGEDERAYTIRVNEWLKSKKSDGSK